jgi:hypothetical protein
MWTDRSVIAYNISDNAVIEKVSLMKLLSNYVTNEKLSIYLASHLCSEESGNVKGGLKITQITRSPFLQ